MLFLNTFATKCIFVIVFFGITFARSRSDGALPKSASGYVEAAAAVAANNIAVVAVAAFAFLAHEPRKVIEHTCFVEVTIVPYMFPYDCGYSICNVGRLERSHDVIVFVGQSHADEKAVDAKKNLRRRRAGPFRVARPFAQCAREFRSKKIFLENRHAAE